MRFVDYPTGMPAGAVRGLGPSGVVAGPEGIGEILFDANDLLLVKGHFSHTIGFYCEGEVVSVLHLTGPFSAAVAPCEVAAILVREQSTTTVVVRWDVPNDVPEEILRGPTPPPEQFYEIAINDDGSRIALYRYEEVLVFDVAGEIVWRRDVGLDDQARFSAVEELAFDGEAILLYRRSGRRDAPTFLFGLERVPETGPIDARFELAQDPPSWFSPPRFARVNAPERAGQLASLALSADGSRIATSLRAWAVATGEPIAMTPSDTPIALAYDATGELRRIRRRGAELVVETCHAASEAIRLPADVRIVALVPGSADLVVATAHDVRIADVTLRGLVATALAVADDGSAIAVALADRVLVFSRDGRSLATHALPDEATGLAVARGGTAIACVAGGALAILRGDEILRGPPNARNGIAPSFSPDGASVVYALDEMRFAFVDSLTAEVRVVESELPSLVDAFAFAPDGASLFTLGADGRVFEWRV